MGDWCPGRNFEWCCFPSGFGRTRQELFEDAPFRLKPGKHREDRRAPGTGGEKVEILKYINPDF